MKEFLAGKRTIIFYLLATTFFVAFIYNGRGLDANQWLWASAMFLGKNLAQNKLRGKK